jgi:hypothetical protein
LQLHVLCLWPKKSNQEIYLRWVDRQSAKEDLSASKWRK